MILLKFQSHFGLILTLIDYPILRSILISIPFWSDFNKSTGQSASSASFQSHFGLILTPVVSYYETVIKTFQSHFGLILTPYRAPAPLTKLNFNPILV